MTSKSDKISIKDFSSLSERWDVFTRILEKISQLSELKTILDEILRILQEVCQCRHLAIRVLDDRGGIPFFSHLGLESEFLESEQWTTVDDCLCGFVAQGKGDGELPFFTERGTFFTNTLDDFLKAVKNMETPVDPGSIRGHCNRMGYQSLAIIPIRAEEQIIAELYLSDETKNLFSEDKVMFLEKLADQIGVAIQNSRLYTQLKESQSRLEELFHSASVGIIEMDTKGSIIRINDYGARLLGFVSPDELLEDTIGISDLTAEELQWQAFIEQVDEKGTARSRPIAFTIGKDRLHLEFSLRAVKGSRDLVTGYRGTFFDITDSIRLQEERLDRARSESLKKRYYQEIAVLKEELKTEYPFEEMIGTSAQIQTLKEAIRQVAPTDTTVLIKGETGTGKELVARYIHQLSHRKDRILVKVNCAALSEGLITSELFGHEKGAFTGAVQRRTGRFEFADKATIFLDEIGDLPLETQAMLLRVLQDGEFERVGSSKTLKVDVRVLAATNRDLTSLVREKNFREDLYFRLNVFPLEIVPLRDRREDIPLLAAYFLEIFSKKLGKGVREINRKTLDLFQSYSWPGNIRELQNVIEQGVVISKGSRLEIKTSYFSREPGSRDELHFQSMENHERDYIREILRHTGGVVYGDKGAARILKMKPTTLQSRIKKLGIDKEDISTPR